MAVLVGTPSVTLICVSVFVAVLTYITYKLLSGYLYKWFTLKKVPGMEGTYPFVGNALSLKTSSGGKNTFEHFCSP